MPPLLTEEEIKQMINTQPTYKPSCEQNIFVPPAINAIYHKLESKLVDRFKEEQTGNPICLIGEIIYVDDSPNFDQYNDDDVVQTKSNLTEPSVVVLWEEYQYHQLEKINQPIQFTYEIDEESL